MGKITDCRTEYKINPLGMDEPRPRFSYTLEEVRGLQKTRQLLVTDESGRVLWDSGAVLSGESVQIVYDGAPLRPFTRCFWTVRVETDAGETVESDGGAFFETGFLGTPWTGRWISGMSGLGPYRPASRLARTFTVERPVRCARLYSTALGVYKPFLNGEPVSEDRLSPGWSQYSDHVQYQAYDVTVLLRPGRNALAALVGDGWFCGVISYVGVPSGKTGYGTHPLFRAELRIEYAYGTQTRIGTDESWNSFYLYPALLNNDIYLGEEYDAMMDDVSWKLPLPEGTETGHAVEETYDTAVVWNSGEPVRVIRELAPVRITRTASGTHIVDFGVNLTGVEQLRIPGRHPGLAITVRHGEMLDGDGVLYRDNLLFAKQTTVFTCGKAENPVYAPEFTYYGFRYLEISGWPGELTGDMVRALVLSTQLPRTGVFSCSNDLVNRLYANILRSQEGNFLDVPTDCPQRCERFGWTGDAQVFAGTAAFNSYVPAFFTKWIADLNASLEPVTGTYPALAPDPAQRYRSPGSGGAGWADAGIVCPWTLFRRYGDTRIIERYYENMKRYADYQEASAHPHTIGDHLNLDAPTDRDYIGSVLLGEMLRILERMADCIGREADAAAFRARRGALWEKLRARYYPDGGELTVGTQTAAAMALVYGLYPDENARKKTAAQLVRDIVGSRGLHLSTGFLGTPILLRALSESGELELAYALLEQTSYPSWLYPVTQGATTVWERWNGWTEENGFFPPDMNSFNHYAYGAVGEWLFDTVCGIRDLAEEDISFRAYRHFRLAPRPGGSLQHARASLRTPYGTVESAWERRGDRLSWRFTVPCGTTAEVVFPRSTTPPASAEGLVRRGGRLIALPGTYDFRELPFTPEAGLFRRG